MMAYTLTLYKAGKRKYMHLSVIIALRSKSNWYTFEHLRTEYLEKQTLEYAHVGRGDIGRPQRRGTDVGTQSLEAEEEKCLS